MVILRRAKYPGGKVPVSCWSRLARQGFFCACTDSSCSLEPSASFDSSAIPRNDMPALWPMLSKFISRKLRDKFVRLCGMPPSGTSCDCDKTSELVFFLSRARFSPKNASMLSDKMTRLSPMASWARLAREGFWSGGGAGIAKPCEQKNRHDSNTQW